MVATGKSIDKTRKRIDATRIRRGGAKSVIRMQGTDVVVIVADIASSKKSFCHFVILSFRLLRTNG